MPEVRNPHRNAIDRVVVAFLAALLLGTGVTKGP